MRDIRTNFRKNVLHEPTVPAQATGELAATDLTTLERGVGESRDYSTVSVNRGASGR